MPAYPRPDFRRPALNWLSLDGPWDFLFDDADRGLMDRWQDHGLPRHAAPHATREIHVPYAFQTPASGIGLHEVHEVLWYERTLPDIRSAEEQAQGHRLVLRFGAVDHECTVWVDGQHVGGHRGGHVPFEIDVSDALRAPGPDGLHRLTVRVTDSASDLGQLRGKQYWGPVPQEIFYPPTSGIWLSVWLESLPPMRVGSSSAGTVLRADDIHGGHLHARLAVLGRLVAAECAVEIEARLAGTLVSRSRQPLPRDKDWVELEVDMRVPDPTSLKPNPPFHQEDCWQGRVALWAPEHPILYNLTLRLYDASGRLADVVETTTGMRSISWTTGDGTFRLNGKPCFQTLVLDQGYWPHTGLTPPSQEALRADIEMAKQMGLNGCRKHQKVEDPVFHWWADQLGFLVWGEIANAYEFSDEYINRFNREWVAAVRRDINHPCIVAWTPFNESWGYPGLKDNIPQRNHIRSVYYLTKTLDPTRPINDNCGWEHVATDLTTYHDYADAPALAASCADFEGGILGPKSNRAMFVGPIASSPAGLLDPGARHTPGAPVICSEFGGVNIIPAQGTEAGERDWGYTTATDPEDLLGRLERLVMAVVKGGHSCGLVYTQLCDIEQEVNGLYSYDRKAKVPAARVKAIMDAAHQYYYDHVAPK